MINQVPPEMVCIFDYAEIKYSMLMFLENVVMHCIRLMKVMILRRILYAGQSNGFLTLKGGNI